MRNDLIDSMDSLINQTVRGLSLELVDWSSTKCNGILMIDVVADKPGGGITIDECAAINKQLVKEIDAQQWFGDDYVVEVSSPGLDRTLKTFKDFSRAIGRQVRVHLKEPVGQKLEYHGKISQVNENEIILNVKDKILNIPLKLITTAVQMIEFE